MPFSKQEVKDGLESSTNVQKVHKWFPEREKIVFEPKGYDDKNFSLKTETMNSIHGMGWEIREFYDGFVVIQKRENTVAAKKLEEIRSILD